MSSEQTVCHIDHMVLILGFSNVNEDPSLSGSVNAKEALEDIKQRNRQVYF
jgi:hypothetical protein